jgi:hypothetical protein
MVDNVTELSLKINSMSESEDEELELITRRLREEILKLDVENVDLVKAGETPKGARSGDVVALGSLLVTLATSGGVIPSLINTVQSWLGRTEKGHSITLEIDGDKLEVTGISSQKQQQLIDTWIKHQEAKMKTND